MRIEKEGYSNKSLGEKRFTCTTCGCIFYVTEKEYSYSILPMKTRAGDVRIISCKCPMSFCNTVCTIMDDVAR